MNIPFLLLFILGSVSSDISYEQLLTKEAQKALSSGKVSKAASIYEAAKILLPNNRDVILNLAVIYKNTGRYQSAIRLYNHLLKHNCFSSCKTNCYSQTECKEFKVLKSQLANSKNIQNQVPLSQKAPKLAKKLFRQSLKLKKKKKYKLALKYLLAVSRLNPDLPGTYRHLGEIYAKLKQKKEADKFYLWYLKTRPTGINASKVKRRLSKEARKSLGKLSIISSWRCYVAIGSEILRSKRGRRLKTPIKKVSLPAGHYGVGFICPKYHLARRFWIDIKKGKTTKVNFKFGAIKVRLKPWARILLKNTNISSKKYKYMDLGLFDIIGLPVGKYTLKLVAFNKTKTKELQINIKPKKILKIKKW